MNKVISFTVNQQSVSSQTEQTMSSREIAVVTGKAHRNVKRDILVMFKELGIDALKYEQTYLDGSNRKQTEYLLPRFEFEVLITGYDVQRRAKALQRWFDLETGRVQPKYATEIDSERLLSVEQRIDDIDKQLEDPTNRIHLTEPPEGYACASVLQEFIPYSFSFVKKTLRYFKLTPVYYLTLSTEGEKYPVKSYDIEYFMTAAALVEEESKQISPCYKEHPVVGRFRNR
ncbi:Rha family transcriptional regulator [Endozoicomonas ascidiicola]|uniref:Rha family transcriptional regulator n=1 Tax=Endozoicomonas ascidiicola TaxID=1698521 RepID=UPI00083415C5|nr:Rha family transcriptional regulator [Endozoicomonas ascidiicola]